MYVQNIVSKWSLNNYVIVSQVKYTMSPNEKLIEIVDLDSILLFYSLCYTCFNSHGGKFRKVL